MDRARTLSIQQDREKRRAYQAKEAPPFSDEKEHPYVGLLFNLFSGDHPYDGGSRWREISAKFERESNRESVINALRTNFPDMTQVQAQATADQYIADARMQWNEAISNAVSRSSVNIVNDSTNAAIMVAGSADLFYKNQANRRRAEYRPVNLEKTLPEYRALIYEGRKSLPSRYRRSGNVAVANININININIEGISNRTMLAHSRVDTARNQFVGQGVTRFESRVLPNRSGEFLSRNTDSEYKILSNLSDQLGNNRYARGTITIFTERPACASCLDVAKQFQQRYPNIDIKIFDNSN